MRSFVVASVALWTLSSCAKSALSTETSTAAIRGAQEAGARDVPAAAYHVQLARELQNQAKELADHGRKDEAESLLTRATADAELAVALSHAVTAEKLAAEAAAKNAELKKENMR
jgi:hypothetical protein